VAKNKMDQFKLDPALIIDIIVKRRWIILVPLFLTLIVGMYMAVTLPRIYESSTLILVQPQKVPENYVKSLVSLDLATRINAIRQQIMSRSNLERIIEKFGLFSKPEHQDLFLEEKVSRLKNAIRVEVNRGRGRSTTDTFSVSFQGTDPESVQKVANTLATFVLDENLKLRESQAIGTSSFLEEELMNTRKRLAEIEDKLRQYRKKYLGELPEQLQTNLKILDRFQEQLTSKQESLRDAQQMINVIDRQIADERKISSSRSAQTITVLTGDTVAQPTDLKSLEEELQRLKNRYTAKHPDVLRLQKLIADLHSDIEKRAGDIKDQGAAPKSNVSQSRIVDSEIVLNLKRQRFELQIDIRNYKADMIHIQKQIQEYQRRVENAPKREEELLSLRRDYDNMNASYNSLLQRKLESEISVNLEKKQKGEQFRIIDTARLPELPFKPNLKRLFMVVIALGLAIGGGIIVLLEFLNTSFRRPQEIEESFGISVLAMVPPIRKTRESIWIRINWALTILFGFITASLAAGYFYISFRGIDAGLELARKIIDI
jgi:polysaccharide chain length determinant protein (PEP-CTERM system associated)